MTKYFSGFEAWDLKMLLTVLCAVVVCAIFVSLFWVFIIYTTKKKWKEMPPDIHYSPQDFSDRCYTTKQHLLPPTHAVCTNDSVQNVTPLLASSSGDGYAAIITSHDSGSEHSSGKVCTFKIFILIII